MTKLFSVFIIFGLLLGCGSAPVKKEGDRSTESFRDPYAEFCTQLVGEFNEYNFSRVSKSADTSTMARNILVGISAPAPMKQQLSQSFNRQLASKIKQVELGLAASESWFQIKVENSKRCVLHSEFTDSGMMFFEFSLMKNEGEVKIIDWRDYMSNTLMSDSIRTVTADLLKLAPKSDASNAVLNRVNQESILAFFVSTRSGDVESMWSSYQNLPIELQSESTYLNPLLLAINTESDIYPEIMEQYKNNVPAEKQGFILYDYYLTQNDLAGAMQTVQNMESATSPDAVFNLLRAGACGYVEDKGCFISYALKTIEGAEFYSDAYWSILDFMVKYKHYDEAVLTLSILEETFGYSITESLLGEYPEYTEFIASTEFKAWLKH